MQLMKRPVLISVASLLVLAVVIGGFLFLNMTDEFTGPIQVQLTLNGEEYLTGNESQLTQVDETQREGMLEYLIGEEMILALTIWTEAEYQVESPTITPPEGLELVKTEVGEVEKRRKYWKYVDTYYFRTYRPGEYELADLEVSYTTTEGIEKELTLEAPTLVVKSILTEEATDIRGLKPLAEPKRRILIYLLLAGTVLILALIGYLVYRLMRKKNQVVTQVEPPLQAHELAYQRLRQLEQAGYIERGEIERYFTILSQIVREYIEKRFAVRAQEMTTQEFLAEAVHSVAMQSDHQHLLREFMIQADLVKYAKHIPDGEQIKEAFLAAQRFVDETKLVHLPEDMEGGVE